MARNMEFKAKIANYDEMYNRVKTLTKVAPVVLFQQDIFYGVKKGRLKLRSISNEQHEIIYYNRKDTLAPKISEYYRFKVRHYNIVNNVLSLFLGRKEVVKKERYLFLKDNVRFHLDKVFELGTFMEIEYIMSEKESITDAQNKVNLLLNCLEINSNMLIQGSYADMLHEKSV